MITVLDLAEEDTSLAKKSVNEKSGPCPECGGKDRFNVKWNGESWVFMCRGCWDSEQYLTERDRKRGWGSEVQYLMHYRGMKYSQALAFLVDQGNMTLDEAVQHLSKMEPDRARALLIRYGATEDGSMQETPRRRPQRGSDQSVPITDPAKQELYHRELLDAIGRLRSNVGQDALNYLYNRGFPDDLIAEAHIGFSLKGGVPRLIIPSINGGRVVAIYRRDLRPDVPHEERWRDAPGSLDNQLYLADCLQRKDKVVVLVESALDALSVIVACGYDLVNVVATGGIKKCRNPLVLGKLARMPLILVAFDADKDGDEAAKWWLKRLANSSRLRPILHDVNDMLVDQWDIQEWIEQGIAKATGQDLHSTETVLFEKPLCATCVDTGLEVEALEDEAEDGLMYCARHHPARQSAHAQFMEAVTRVAAVFPSGCEIEQLDCSAREYIARRCAEIDEQNERNREAQRERDRAVFQAAREKKYARLRERG
jgi:DNA primase